LNYENEPVFVGVTSGLWFSKAHDRAVESAITELQADGLHESGYDVDRLSAMVGLVAIGLESGWLIYADV
jgi:hypothetical protein